MILKKISEAYRGLDLKTVVYSALPIYWLILLTSTFLHWSWRLQKVTELGSHPTRLASTWSTHRTRLFLLLAPWSLGPAACTLARRFWSLWTLAWSLNPWPPAGTLVAWSLRACKLVPTLLKFFYSLGCPIIHLVFTVTDIGYGPVPARATAAAFVVLFRGRARTLASRWCYSRRPRPEVYWSLVNHMRWHSNN